MNYWNEGRFVKIEHFIVICDLRMRMKCFNLYTMAEVWFDHPLVFYSCEAAWLINKIIVLDWVYEQFTTPVLA